MKANDLKRFEVLQTDQDGNYLVLNAQRVIVFPVAALVNIIKDLMHVMGQDKMDVVMTRFGYETGITSAVNVMELYDFDNRAELIKAGFKLLDFAGMAGEENQEITITDNVNEFKVNAEFNNSFQAVSWLANFGKSEGPVCNILASIASGYLSTIMGTDILAKETKCMASGDNVCMFEARTLDGWGIDANSLRKRLELDHLDEHIKSLNDTLESYKKNLKRQNREIASLKKKIKTEKNSSGIVYRSATMHHSLEVAKKVAPTMAGVLINGESGTGKELVARFIHRNSQGKTAPFLAVSCAALPPNLLESEFFGHVKGAFTGADSDKKGLLEEAGGGTFFLDEVGELPLDLQAKLLRALQEKEIRPVGGVRNIPIHCRIVAATNRDLKKMMNDGIFREDLFYRLAVVPMTVSPLRERIEDILLLSRHFIQKNHPDHPGLSPETVRCLEAYPWPGNVRELENCIQYAMVFAGNDLIRISHLPLTLTEYSFNSVAVLGQDLPDLKELQKRYIENVLEKTGGNKTRASEILGISITTLWRRLNEYGISEAPDMS